MTIVDVAMKLEEDQVPAIEVLDARQTGQDLRVGRGDDALGRDAERADAERRRVIAKREEKSVAPRTCGHRGVGTKVGGRADGVTVTLEKNGMRYAVHVFDGDAEVSQRRRDFGIEAAALLGEILGEPSSV